MPVCHLPSPFTSSHLWPLIETFWKLPKSRSFMSSPAPMSLYCHRIPASTRPEALLNALHSCDEIAKYIVAVRVLNVLCWLLSSTPFPFASRKIVQTRLLGGTRLPSLFTSYFVPEIEPYFVFVNVHVMLSPGSGDIFTELVSTFSYEPPLQLRCSGTSCSCPFTHA